MIEDGDDRLAFVLSVLSLDVLYRIAVMVQDVRKAKCGEVSIVFSKNQKELLRKTKSEEQQTP